MSFKNIKIFIFGVVFGMVIFLVLLWYFWSLIFNSTNGEESFFGARSLSEIVEAKKDLKLYQDGKEIGVLFKGAKLEKTLHVDKIDHYRLNFEPFSYKDVKEIIDEDKEIEDFSVTDLIYMGDTGMTPEN